MTRIFRKERSRPFFFEALDIHDLHERAMYLDRTCGQNADLHNAVEVMLKDHACASEYFSKTLLSLPPPDSACCSDELADGAMLGVYRIVKEVGEGGCGKVYEAEQVEPVKRRVALKILKLGMDTKAVIGRFEAERQALAMMEHPNIAHVFDAGSTAAGRPYFVMEFVQGTKITEYCKTCQLSVKERLHLMLQVCSAVQHAHNKGIIHRDLKPSNILVTMVDGVAVPKIIDFGIAKATTPTAELLNGHTILGQPLGTPAYMSPEQFEAGFKNVDARSDVYSLGVILYELLAGKPPFDNDQLVRAGYDEMRRCIHDVTPRTPSHARNPHDCLDWRDLDCIVMQAINKDRDLRYASVQAFAGDLGHYLRNEPINAHPPSSLYRLRKLFRRNKIASLSVVLASLFVLTVFAISSWFYSRASVTKDAQRKMRAEAEERACVARAAILIMQQRRGDADKEIRGMAGDFSQPSVDAYNVFHSLALWNASIGDWKASSERWLAMIRVSCFDENDLTDHVTQDFLPVAPTLLLAGEYGRYREFQTFLIQHFGKTTDLPAGEHLLKLCLLTPASPEIISGLRNIAFLEEQSLPGDEATSPDNFMEAWRCVALGLWYYRNGQPDKAISWCNRSLLCEDWEEVRSVVARVIRGMSRRSLGNVSGAVQDLDVAREFIRSHADDPIESVRNGHYHDWLNAQLLLHEADGAVLAVR